ncbi:MAG: hypothetical protein C5B58_06180 [Acidobacteria bacterium]|nr:MAG: hypothetical protein C5B58_06180 [Acidobacteriota bacterium]
MNHAALKRRTRPAFFYLDLDDTVRRAALLTAAVRDKIPTIASLKREYARTLSQISDAPLNTAGEPRVVAGGPLLGIATTRGLVDKSVGASSYNAQSRTIAIRHVQHALLFLRLQHPPLRELCDLLITDILCWPSVKAAGGSTGDLLGVIWLAPSPGLTALDIAECVIHEMVHMNLHLADMTFGLFTRARAIHFRAYSAVLGRRRPYYHAFHSACVAVAMIYFRLLLGLHGEANGLRSTLQRCTSDLLGHQAAFTPRAWNAILAARAFSRAPTLSAIPVHKHLRRA